MADALKTEINQRIFNPLGLVQWTSGTGSLADHGRQIGRNRHDRRPAIGKGPNPWHVAIGAPRKRRAGQDEGKGNYVAEGSHPMSPLAIWTWDALIGIGVRRAAASS